MGAVLGLCSAAQVKQQIFLIVFYYCLFSRNRLKDFCYLDFRLGLCQNLISYLTLQPYIILNILSFTACLLLWKCSLWTLLSSLSIMQKLILEQDYVRSYVTAWDNCSMYNA